MSQQKEWSIALNTGVKIPAFGLMTWQSKSGEVETAVEAALREGYRHIDCAQLYMNEGEVGAALQKCFQEGVVRREDVFVTSKLSFYDHAPEDVLPACELTLKNLQLDHLDLYLVHTPFRVRKEATYPYSEEDKFHYDPEFLGNTWNSMEDLVDKGLVKAIGISNFTITKTKNLLKTAKIVPAVNQVECHPYFQQPKLKEYCDKKGIVLQAYSPLGGLSRSSKTDAEPAVMEDPVIKEIAGRLDATPAQVCIAYGLHRGIVVIPKTVNLSRIVENYKSTSLSLTEDDIERLATIDRNRRLFRTWPIVKEGLSQVEIWDIQADQDYLL